MLITNLNAPRYTVEYDEPNDCWMIRDGMMIKGRFANGQREMADRYVAYLNRRDKEKPLEATA